MNSPGLVTDVNLFTSSDGQRIVHAPLHGQAFYVDDLMAELIELLQTEPERVDIEREAERLAALRLAGLYGEQRTHYPQTSVLEAFRPVEATLIFTESCNLGCTYCYASSLPTKSKSLPRELVRSAVDLVCENAAASDAKLASFRFIGGGEPTVEWGLLEYATNYIEKRCKKTEVNQFIRLITNGTLLNPKRVDWLARNIDFITLSFDILPDLQAKRSYASGANSHSKLVLVVQDLAASGVAFHLRSTVSAVGASRLVEMVEYAHAICGPVEIRFEPMSEVGRSIAEGETKPPQEQFVESFKAAYHRGRELGVSVTCKQFTNHKRKSSRFCDSEFSVTPEGAVSGCHRYSREEHEGYDLFRIGRYEEGAFRFDLDQINRLRGIDVYQFKDCITCSARWNCASGCLSARMGGGEVRQHGPLCHLTRELLAFSIEQTMKENSDD